MDSSATSGSVVIKPLPGQGQPVQAPAATEEEAEDEEEEEGVLGSLFTCISDHAIICCHAMLSVGSAVSPVKDCQACLLIYFHQEQDNLNPKTCKTISGYLSMGR